jgi:hypothetical protein
MLRRGVVRKLAAWWRRRRGWEWFDTYDGGEWRRVDKRRPL